MRTQGIAVSGLIVCISLSGLALMGSGCAGDRYQRSTGTYLDDKGVATRVKTALFRDPVVSGFDVHVNTFRGDVQLSGFVDTPEQKDRAAQIAREVAGVQSVTNNLEIKPANTAVGAPGSTVSGTSPIVTSPPDRPAADAPRNLAPVRTPSDDLDRRFTPLPAPAPIAVPAPMESRVSHSHFNVSTSKGRAVLRGTVGSETEKSEIERHVREIPGVQTVDNRLEVDKLGW